MLDRVQLSIMIGDELLDPFANENPAETLTAGTKNAAANRGGLTKIPRIDVERNATLGEDAKYDVYALVKLIAGPKTRLSKSPSHVEIPRLRRLLKPLRVLHSIGSLYIDAPISERYRKEFQTSLSRARRSIFELLSLLHSAYTEAMMVFRAAVSPW